MPKKRKDGRYARSVTVGHRPDGSAVKRTVYATTVRELERKVREVQNLVAHGIAIDLASITVHDLLEQWYRVEKVPNLKPQTLAEIRSKMKRIDGSLGQLRAADLTAFHVEAFRAQMIEEGRYAMCNHCLSVLRSVLAYGVKHDILLRNVAAGVSPARDPNRTPKRELSILERKKIADAPLDPVERAFVSVLLYAGLRRGEATALLVSDVHLDEGYIDVNKTVTILNEIQPAPKTSAGVRRVPVTGPLAAALAPVLEGRSPFEPLFVGRALRHWSPYSVDRRWKKISAKVFGEHVPDGFTPHILRHSFASDLYRAGMPLKAAQYILGHSDAGTTLNVYTHFGYEDIERSRLDTFYESRSEVGQALQKAK